MRPADTDQKTWDVWIEMIRSMPPGEKLRRVIEASDIMVEMQEAGMRLRHPAASSREITIRAAAVRHGRELVERAYGWTSNPDEPLG